MEGIGYTIMLISFAEMLGGAVLWFMACIAAGLVGAVAAGVAFLLIERAFGADYLSRSGGLAPVRARRLLRSSGNRCALSLPLAIAASVGVSVPAFHYLTGAVSAWLGWAGHHG